MFEEDKPHYLAKSALGQRLVSNLQPGKPKSHPVKLVTSGDFTFASLMPHTQTLPDDPYPNFRVYGYT